MKKLFQILIIICLQFLTAEAGQPQVHPPSRPPMPQAPAPHIFDSHQQDPQEIEQQKKMQKGLNLERVKEIKQDTDRLLQLATELKKSVDATTENMLSLEVIRKTEEIDKLSKKIRDKMKESYVPVGSSPLPDASRVQ